MFYRGDVLSPTLFSIYLNDLAIDIKNMNLGVNCDGEMISILLYADDIVLLAESEEALQEMINHVADWCHNWRLMINVDKTKIVHFRKSTAPETTFLFRLCDFEIEKVQQYKYLGVYFDYCLTFKYATDVLSSSASRALGFFLY